MKTVKKNIKGKTKRGASKKVPVQKETGSVCEENVRGLENWCGSCGYVVTADDCGCIDYEQYFCCE